jgi:hypothetical protein
VRNFVDDDEPVGDAELRQQSTFLFDLIDEHKLG